MPDREVSVRDPDAVAPAQVGRFRIDVHVGGSDVGDGGEDDGVEVLRVHPVVDVESTGLLQPADQLLDEWDLEHR